MWVSSLSKFNNKNKLCIIKSNTFFNRLLIHSEQDLTQFLFHKQVHHSLTARSVSKSFREGLRKHTQKIQPQLEPLIDESIRFSAECHVERDTASPEHLGIPSSPALIPNRHHYPYPPPGDTSDDSTVTNLSPRKNYRKKAPGGTSSRPFKSAYNADFKREPYIIYD